MTYNVNHLSLRVMIPVAIVCHNSHNLVSCNSSLGMLLRNKDIMVEFLIVRYNKSKVLTLLKGTDNFLHPPLKYLKNCSFLSFTILFSTNKYSNFIAVHGSLSGIFRYKYILRLPIDYNKAKSFLGSRKHPCFDSVSRCPVSAPVICYNLTFYHQKIQHFLKLML